ncbi:MAG: hypothetical protein M5T61_09465 [Acidimicrobiia bacterium]|nr:hypothetical protein [Acidimicrobiia bacterium]
MTPLYVKSLDLPSKLDIVQIPDLFMPQAIYGDIHTVIQKAFIPGTSSKEILADLDTLYAR